MFTDLTKLESLDISNFDMTKVLTYSGDGTQNMFSNLISLKN